LRIHQLCLTALSLTHTSTTALYTLSLHDALPIYLAPQAVSAGGTQRQPGTRSGDRAAAHPRTWPRVRLPLRRWSCSRLSWQTHEDRKSTRLNSSHSQISYAVFCLKKKNNITPQHT